MPLPVNTVQKKKKKSFLNTLIKRLWSAAPLRDQLDHGPKRDRNRNGSHSHSHSSNFTFPWVCFCWFGWLSFQKEWFSTSLDGISIWNQLQLLTLNISLFFSSTALLQLWSSNVRPKPDQEKQSRAMDSLLGDAVCVDCYCYQSLGRGEDLWSLCWPLATASLSGRVYRTDAILELLFFKTQAS